MMCSIKCCLLFFLYLHTYITLVNGISQSSGNKGGSYSKHSNEEWPNDDNEEESKCRVSLWARPCEGSNTEDIAMMHWILVFAWDDQTSSYEANDDYGFLRPKSHSGPPSAHHQGWVGKKLSVGTYFPSPKQVNRAAKNNHLNGFKYSLGHVNCQNWVVALAQELGIYIKQDAIAQESPLYAWLASICYYLGCGKLFSSSKSNSEKGGRYSENSKWGWQDGTASDMSESILKNAKALGTYLGENEALALAKYMLKVDVAGVEMMALTPKESSSLNKYLSKTDPYAITSLAATAVTNNVLSK